MSRAALLLPLLLAACASQPPAVPRAESQVEVVHRADKRATEAERARLTARAHEWVRRFEEAWGPVRRPIRIELWHIPILPNPEPDGARECMGLSWRAWGLILLAVEGNEGLRWLGHELAHLYQDRADPDHEDPRWAEWDRWDERTSWDIEVSK